jgi:hypothetical protein
MPSCWIVDGAMPASARRKNFKSQRRRGIKVSDQLNFQPTMGPIFELGMTETPRTTSSGIGGGKLPVFNLSVA